MQAIVTKWLQPTAKRVARIKASCEAGSITVEQQGTGYPQQHLAAAKALAAKLGWTGTWHQGGLPKASKYEMVHVCQDWPLAFQGEELPSLDELADWAYDKWANGGRNELMRAFKAWPSITAASVVLRLSDLLTDVGFNLELLQRSLECAE